MQVKGFSLLEILITLVLLTVGVIAVTRAFNAGLFASTDSENVRVALDIAQAQMEEIKNTVQTEGIANLADSGPTADTHFSNFNVTVDIAEGQNPMQVDVTVSWNVKGGQPSATLTTLVAEY